MCNRKISERQHALWLTAALVVPLIQTASSCSWPAVLGIGAVCILIWMGLERFGGEGVTGRWLGAIQWLWMLLVISEFLHWTMFCWPEYRNYYAVPLSLLALAAWCAAKGEETASRTGGGLLWIIGLLLGAVLLSGIKEVEWRNLKPAWQMTTAHLITVFLIPVMGLRKGTVKQKAGILLCGALISLITTGVLSLKLVMDTASPFYEMSRSLTLLGIGQRFESLTAAGMTLGYFVLLSYLLTVMGNAWERGKRRERSIWISTAVTALIFLSGMRLNSRLLAIGTVLAWVVFPLLKISKNNLQNLKNNA